MIGMHRGVRGDNAEIAVMSQNVRAMVIEFDAMARHYEVQSSALP